jgi:acetolactate synthase-1/3 small subunit
VDVTRMTFVVEKRQEMRSIKLAAQCPETPAVFVVKVCCTERKFHSPATVPIKVEAPPHIPDEVIQIANIFRANVIDVSHETRTSARFGRGQSECAMDLLEDFRHHRSRPTGYCHPARP